MKNNNILDHVWYRLSDKNLLQGDLENSRKAILLNLIVLSGCVFLSILGTIALIQKNIPLFLADAFCIIFFISLFYYYRTTQKYRESAITGSVVIWIFYFYLYVSGGVNQTAILWIYTLPLVVIFLLGIRTGSIFFFTFFLAMLLAALAAPYSDYITHYPLDFLLRFFPSQLAVYIFCIFTEKARDDVHNNYLKSIAKLHGIQSRLREQTLRDGLTGLYNRAFFDQFSSQVFSQPRRRGGSSALIMIDVDFFKLYNDTYGHVSGDQILIKFGELLQKNCRRETDRVFRYGGEEFAVILTNTDEQYTVTFANRVIQALKELAVPHKKSSLGYVTVSLGIFVSSADDAETHDGAWFISQADKALYRAKQAGRNQYCIERGDHIIAPGDATNESTSGKSG